MDILGSLDAVAAALDGTSLDSAGGNLVVACAGSVDSITPPAVVVEAGALRWANTGRSDGSAALEITATYWLPASTAPVASLMAVRVMEQVRPALVAAGRTLGGTCLAWRVMEAVVGTGQLGGRTTPTVTVGIEIYLSTQ